MSLECAGPIRILQAVCGLSWTYGVGQNEESASRSPAIFDPPVYHAFTDTLLHFAPRSRGDTIHVASAAEQYSQQEVYGFMLAICRRMVLSPDFALALELLFWHHPVSHNYSWLVFMDILPVPYLLPLPLGGSVEHTRSESAGRIGVTSPFGPAARLRRFAAAADLSFSSFPLGGLSLDEFFSSESESGFWFKACKPTLVCYLCNTLQHLPILHQDTCCPSFASRLVCPFIHYRQCGVL